MAYLRNLWRVEIAVILCLLAYAVGFTAIMSALADVYSPGPPSMEGAVVVFGLTIVMGAGPATLFFAPVYAFLRTRGAANLIAAIACGIVPGVFLLFYYSEFLGLGMYAIPAGALVSAATHATMLKWDPSPHPADSPLNVNP